MTRVAFLVDGDLEKRFIENACKGNPIRKIGNGDRFPVKVIAKQVMTQVRLLSNRYENFILLLDREDRDKSPSDFASEIRDALACSGLGSQNIVIVIKDREIEDWMLSDPEAISDFVGAPVDTSGMHGKGALSKLLSSHSIKYSETTTGFEILRSVYCSRAAQRSPSLSYLKDHFPTTCWWLER